jgi:hypothetical protein
MNEEKFLKVVFLYFFELMGINDTQNLMYMTNFVSKNKEEKKLNELFKDADDMTVSFEKFIFFSTRRNSSKNSAKCLSQPPLTTSLISRAT